MISRRRSLALLAIVATVCLFLLVLPQPPSEMAPPVELAFMRPDLERAVPDFRDPECLSQSRPSRSVAVSVIVVTQPGEAAMPVLRTLHGVLAQAQAAVTRVAEIILVLDGALAHESAPFWQNATVRAHLAALDHRHAPFGTRVRVLEQPAARGLLGGRLMGAQMATAPVLVFVDSYVEFEPGWLDALVVPLVDDPKAIVFPRLDWEDPNWSTHKGGIGCRLGLLYSPLSAHEGPVPAQGLNASAPQTIPSPVMFGSVFAIHAAFFSEAPYEAEHFGFGGGEDVELSLRAWSCGGKVLCASCSRCFQVFYKGLPGRVAPGAVDGRRGALRTAAIWLDDHAPLVHVGSGVNPAALDSVMGDISQRLAYKQAKCRNFRWLLQNVYPESLFTSLDTVADNIGTLRLLGGQGAPSCLDTARRVRPGDYLTRYPCNGHLPQHFFLMTRAPFYLMPMQQLEVCLSGATGKWVACDGGFHQPRNVAWTLHADGTLIAGSVCLTDDPSGKIIVAPITDRCSRWAFESVVLLEE